MIAVTGSAGHLGEGLVRTLRAAGRPVLGTDVLPAPYTDRVGSLLDRSFARSVVRGARAIVHTATLHKPHVATHTRQAFVDVNITGTLNLLEEAAAAGVGAFVFTSTTSTFGDALVPPPGAPAAWITEDVRPIPKNIYGVTKTAAEDLCALFHRNHGLPTVVLRTSRFFPEADDRPEVRAAFDDANLKANEYLCRRVDLADAVDAHLLAVERAPALGFGVYIVSATTPFVPSDRAELRVDAPKVVARVAPDFPEVYARLGWRMHPSIDRVYVNARARAALGWSPRFDFAYVLGAVARGADPRSELARAVGSKGYHRARSVEAPWTP